MPALVQTTECECGNFYEKMLIILLLLYMKYVSFDSSDQCTIQSAPNIINCINI